MNILIVAAMFAWFGLCGAPNAFGVAPAPDGGYPGGNTAEGQNALLSLTSGLYNTGIGIFSLLSLTDGSFCTGVGAGTLLANTGDSNTATGAGALFSNTSGTDNTADGTFALFSNTASGNTAIGSNALLNNTTGGTLENIQGIDVGPNVAVGWQALESNTVAGANTALGYQALHSFTTGPVGREQVGLCTAVGFQALANATGGLANSGFGYQALMNNTDGTENTANGAFALFNNTTGVVNTATGLDALFSNTTGSNNTAYGEEALESSTGNHNTAVGSSALRSLTTGDENIAVGSFAGVHLTNGDRNIDIGNQGVAGEANTMRIGSEGSQTKTFIAGIFGASSGFNTVPVMIDNAGQLQSINSSRRFKNEIRPMDKASEALLALKPVTFHYKSDKTNKPQFGLIAEEVAEVNPDLVVRDKNGEIYTVRYDAVNAMLLNEFLKEHKKVEELKNDFQSTVALQKKQIQALTAQLKQQAEQIKEVRAQGETTILATEVALNNP
jgi:hypothetical protein